MKSLRVLLAVGLSSAAFAGFGSEPHQVRVYPNLFSGGWASDAQFMDVMGSPYLLAHGAGRRVRDSRTTVEIPDAGVWRIWVRTRRWVDAPRTTPHPAAFNVSIAGRVLEKTFGLESADWHWEDGGTVQLEKGSVQIALKDLSGFDARCAGLVLAQGDKAPDGALSMKDECVSETVQADLVIIGGGVPGTCAAISAARSGLRVALVQDRPVLGGNASSEIRVWCAGEIANDIVREVRGRFMNMESEATIGDEWRMRLVEDETNIDCRVSCRAFAVEKAECRISAVKSLDLVRNRVIRFTAPLFVDATGDGWIGYWAGADFRMGREARSEYGETMAPGASDGDTLGCSLMWTSRRAGTDESFSAPWAEPWAQGEVAVNGDWNWEYGIHQDVIADGEAIRDRLLLAIYGAFSNAKKDPKNCRQVLNFVPYLLGKRESRRLLGDWVLSEKDVTERRRFEDAVSRGSWSVDLHYDTFKKGVDFLTNCNQPHYGRYYIPFRSLYSRNIPNLMMAGRCFSCTHVGLGGPRVINTLALMGVAVGYAAAECRNRGILPREVYERGLVRGIQRKLGGEWPGNPDPDKEDWRIVDDEDAEVRFGKGWTSDFCPNGGTVNDRFSFARRGREGAGPVEYPLPVEARGRYHLMRNLPFLAWHPVGGRIAARLESEGRVSALSFPAHVRTGGWTLLGTFDMAPGAKLVILPEKSDGPVYADAFAVIPENKPIFGRVADLRAYENVDPAFRRVAAFLENVDLRTLPPGRYEIDGSNCWATVSDATLVPVEDVMRFEAHRDFIDVHVPIDGAEVFGTLVTPEEKMSELECSSRDCVLFRAKGPVREVLPGEFALFLPPHGAHVPGLTSSGAAEKRRKAVIKIRRRRIGGKDCP